MSQTGGGGGDFPEAGGTLDSSSHGLAVSGCRSWRDWVVPIAIVALALAVYLPHVRTLGLFNDDVVQYLQPHHAANGDALGFVLSDVPAVQLRSGERPVAFVPYALGRVAYLAGVPWLIFLQVLLAGLSAACFAHFFRRLADDDVAALAAGSISLLWPISPLVNFWPSTIHYPFAAILSIAAAEVALSRKFARPWLAVLLHVCSFLTVELFLLAAPMLCIVAAVSGGLGLSGRSRRSSGKRRKEMAARVAAMLAASGLFVAWRLFVLPRLGIQGLQYERQVLPLAAVRARWADALEGLLWPWPGSLAAAEDVWPHAPRYALVGLLASGGFLALAVVLGSRGSRRRAPPARILLASAAAALIPGRC